MPKRELHVMVEDDGTTMRFKVATLVCIGGIDVPVIARQFDQLSLPNEAIEDWQRDTVTALLEEL